MKLTYYTQIEVPKFGTFLALSEGQALTGLYTVDQKYVPQKDSSWQYAPELPLFVTLATQLQEFWSGNRKRFDIPHCFAWGTPFQKKVWHALAQIPYGQTTTYGSLAHTLGAPNATRAVGAAIGRNPLLVIVPCHRVVGMNGELTGFAAGIDKKRCLLKIEQGATETKCGNSHEQGIIFTFDKFSNDLPPEGLFYAQATIFYSFFKASCSFGSLNVDEKDVSSVLYLGPQLVCFHFAAEMMLKALLSLKKKEVAHTHKLKDLLEEACKCYPGLMEVIGRQEYRDHLDILGILGGCCIDIRYLKGHLQIRPLKRVYAVLDEIWLMLLQECDKERIAQFLELNPGLQA